MRSLVLLAASAAAFQPWTLNIERRTLLRALPALPGALLAPAAARADRGPDVMPGGGFGENFYKNQQFNGLEEAPEGSVPYPLFLQSLKAKLVERVEFEPPSGDVAYAYMRIDGDDKPATKVRMGQGWPVALGNSWSDPIWVVRILENEGVPYKFNFDLAKKEKFPRN